MRTQIALKSDPTERTPACSQTEITGSGRKFERTTVSTMVWIRSGRRSIWSEKSHHKRIRAHLSLIINCSGAIGSDRKRIRVHLSLIINGSSVNWSDQKCYQTQLGLIRGHFERFIFSIFFHWEMLALPRASNTAAFWSETHLKSDNSDQKKNCSW